MPAKETQKMIGSGFLFFPLEIVIISSDYLWNNPRHRPKFPIGQEALYPWPGLYNGMGL